MTSITINFDKQIDLNAVYNQIKALFPEANIIKNIGEYDDLLLASESSLDFWDNDIDDEVWNNV